MIEPGKKIDVVQLWIADNGYEITFKGQTTLPKEQVEDYYRRRAHSIEEVVHNWLKAPGVMVVSEGTVMVVRRLADRVTVLTATNDAVTLDLDATRIFRAPHLRWRNPSSTTTTRSPRLRRLPHHPGPAHAAHITRYHKRAEMSGQRFLTPCRLTTAPQPIPLRPPSCSRRSDGHLYSSVR